MGEYYYKGILVFCNPKEVVNTKIDKDLISSKISAFLVFNKLNSVKGPLATYWTFTVPKLDASKRKCWYFCILGNFLK